jgi:hypothetical protein
MFVENAQSDEDIVGRAPKDVCAVLLVFRAILVRADQDIGPALAPIGAGQPEVAERPLPEVENAASCQARRVIDLDRTVLQIAEIEDVGRRKIRRDDAALFL